MKPLNLIIEALTFLLVSGSVLYAYTRFEGYYTRSIVMKRLTPNQKEAKKYGKRRREVRLESLLLRLGVVALPSEGKDIRQIKSLLTYAGYRSANATVNYFGLKILSALASALIYVLYVLVSGNMDIRTIVLVFFPLALGYYLPGIVLKRKVSYRRFRIFRELPNAIDLILICMEAGLSFDMAVFRVSRELSELAAVLSGEFNLYFFEIKSGLSRQQALKNLAERNGERSLSSVVQVLLQSLKFGSDIAEALRHYATSLRRERIQIAEEKGGKVSIKLTFVTVLLIMPAYLLVVLGPMLVRMKEIFFK